MMITRSPGWTRCAAAPLIPMTPLPRAGGNVDDSHLFAFEQVGRLHQRGVERDRPDIVEISLSHRRAVNLGLHHDPHHRIGGSLSASGLRPIGDASY